MCLWVAVWCGDLTTAHLQAAAAAKPAKPVHTLVMHMKDGQPLVAVEAGSKAGGKAASKAASKATSKATSKAGAEKQPMFTLHTLPVWAPFGNHPFLMILSVAWLSSMISTFI